MVKNQVNGGSDLAEEENPGGGGLKQCPGCGHRIQRKLQEWLGLPAGVKFDPTDQELLDHLEAKVEESQPHCKSHPLIDEFIPTIEGEGGICYTHPEKLPGVKRNGLSRHYFHRPSKAYTTGTRKRRKIQTECDIQGGETRWHKTGKTRAVMVSGKQKGCKKILVLYTNFGKNRKPEKTNWVMHQYHLGMFEEEKEGELVVSKIFYQTQPRQCSWSERSSAVVNEVIINNNTQCEEQLCCGGGADDASDDAFPSYIQHLQSHNAHAFPSFQTALTQGDKNCTVVANSGDGEHSTQENHNACHHKHVAAGTTFVSSAPPASSTSQLTILHHDSYDLSTFVHPNQRFQNDKNQQGRGAGMASPTGLEEVVLRCTPPDIKDGSGMGNAHDLEWSKYSFWQDPNGCEHQR